MNEQSVTTELGFATFERDLPTVRGVYSAEEFKRLKPSEYDLCVRALALGYKLDQIRKALGVAWETVRAVRDRDGENIREHKKRLAGLCFGIAERALEELFADDKRMGKLDAIQIGILMDKGLLMSGEATSINENRQTMPALDGLFQAMRDVAGKHAGGMGLKEGESLQEGAGSGLARGAGAPGLGDGSRSVNAWTNQGGAKGTVVEAEWEELGVDKH